MSQISSLNPISDPFSLAKLQILLVPVHPSSSSSSNQPTLSESTFEYWTSLIKRHSILRGDELRRSSQNSSSSSGTSNHGRGGVNSDPRARFLPASSGTSISRSASTNHVHLAYPSHPPARHLYPLSLFRLTEFPLVVIGIAVDPGEKEPAAVNGYSLEDEGDIGQAGSSNPPKISTSGTSPSDAFTDGLGNLFPSTSPFPLVQRLVIVPPHIPHSPTPNPSPTKDSRRPVQSPRNRPGLNGVHTSTEEAFTRYAPSHGVEAWLGRLLGEAVGEVLGELGELAASFETTDGLNTLSATLLPSLTITQPHPTSDTLFTSPASTPTSFKPGKNGIPSLTQSTSVPPAGTVISRALTPGGRPTSVQPASLPPIQTAALTSPSVTIAQSANPFRRSTALTSPFSRTSSASSALSSSTSSSATTLSSASKYTSAPLAGVAGGRLLKLIGDMYLISGMYGDAIRCFDDGAERCRSVGDVLWEAGAREGRAVAGIGEAWDGRDGSNMSTPFPSSPIPVEILSHFLSSLSCLSRSPLPFPPTILSPSPQAISGSISFAPSAPNPAQTGTGEGLLAYLYTNLCLRISHFMLIIWSSGGWGSIALSSLVGHHLPRSFHIQGSSARSRKLALAKLGASSQISRHTVLGHAEAGLGPFHKALTPVEQVALHVEAVWLARWLGLERKEGRFSREVVNRIRVMIIEGREESRRFGLGGFSRGAKALSSASTSAQPSSAADMAVGLGLGIAVTTASQAVAVRRKESTEGNQGVMKLFERVCEIAGIILVPLGSDLSGNSGDWKKEKEGPRFGWPELQVEMMKEGIAVAEALPDNPSVIRLCISALRSLYPYLNGTSQGHLSKMYPQALATVRRRGIEIGNIPWWLPGRVVLSVEIASLAPNKLPIEHAHTEIIDSQTDSSKGRRDPFLYNPRLKAAGAGKTVIVAKEQVDIYVTIQNPFGFDLEIQDLSLVTSGVPFSTSPLPLTLPASSIQTVRVAGLATSAGTLQIRGVSLRLKDGSTTDILLPVLDDQRKLKRDKRKSRLRTELNKVKKVGLEARDPVDVEMEGLRDSGSVEDFDEKWLECTVVEEQPLLWIKKSSLIHGTVMLYNGESSIIRITLENSSSVPVDFIKLSFDDSTAREAQTLIAEGELTPEQAYEIEGEILNRPVFTWEDRGEGTSTIPPGGRTTLTIRCLGKVGCTDGSIRIDYGYVRQSNEESSADSSLNTFQTRQITFPVLFTVYHTLDFHSLDLVRFSGTQGSSSPRRKDSLFAPNGNGSGILSPSGLRSGSRTPVTSGYLLSAEDVLKAALADERDADHCLLAVSVRNVYGVPFEVVLTRKGDDESQELSAVRLVPPGATERLIIPIRRLSLQSEILSQPIPSLSERQYVVDKLKKSAGQAQLARELFWYKEELLKTIQATWREPGSLRHGTFSLRDQEFTPALLDVLRLDGIDINLVVQNRAVSDVVRTTEFVDIRVTITNNLERPFRPHVRLEPLPSSSSDNSWTTPPTATTNRRPQSQPLPPSHVRNIAFDGSLSQILPEVQPGQNGLFKISVVFLASGDFSFRAAVEEIELDRIGAVDPGTEPPLVRFSDVLNVTVGL